jgi:hypothetical protein
MTNTRHAKPLRNADVAFRILVLGYTPVRVAGDEDVSLPRINQIVSQYAAQVLGVPPEHMRGIRTIKAFVTANCIVDGKLVQWRPRA